MDFLCYNPHFPDKTVGVGPNNRAARKFFHKRPRCGNGYGRSAEKNENLRKRAREYDPTNQSNKGSERKPD
jgi:hypothetical protein